MLAVETLKGQSMSGESKQLKIKINKANFLRAAASKNPAKVRSSPSNCFP